MKKTATKEKGLLKENKKLKNDVTYYKGIIARYQWLIKHFEDRAEESLNEKNS